METNLMKTAQLSLRPHPPATPYTMELITTIFPGWTRSLVSRCVCVVVVVVVVVVRACVRACMRACVHACVCVCVCSEDNVYHSTYQSILLLTSQSYVYL